MRGAMPPAVVKTRGVVSLFYLIYSCFVFAIFLLFCFVKEAFVRVVEVASGEW